MSIRIGLCRFSFSFFALLLVLVCVVVLGWKSGRDGWGWKVKLYTIGKTVFLFCCNLEEEGEEQRQTNKTDKKNT